MDLLFGNMERLLQYRTLGVGTILLTWFGLNSELRFFFTFYDSFYGNAKPWTRPVGTGFSQGKPNITSEEEAAEQFLGFFKNFVDTFDLHHRKVYIAGESYAGLYVPYIADAMFNKEDTKYYNIQNTLIYDPSINEDAILEQGKLLSP